MNLARTAGAAFLQQLVAIVQNLYHDNDCIVTRSAFRGTLDRKTEMTGVELFAYGTDQDMNPGARRARSTMWKAPKK